MLEYSVTGDATFTNAVSGRNPFFAQVEDFDDHGQGTGGGHFNPNDPMMAANLSSLNSVARANQYPERFSRKVFVGGLPPDIDEGYIRLSVLPLNCLTS